MYSGLTGVLALTGEGVERLGHCGPSVCLEGGTLMARGFQAGLCISGETGRYPEQRTSGMLCSDPNSTEKSLYLSVFVCCMPL